MTVAHVNLNKKATVQLTLEEVVEQPPQSIFDPNRFASLPLSKQRLTIPPPEERYPPHYYDQSLREFFYHRVMNAFNLAQEENKNMSEIIKQWEELNGRESVRPPRTDSPSSILSRIMDDCARLDRQDGLFCSQPYEIFYNRPGPQVGYPMISLLTGRRLSDIPKLVSATLVKKVFSKLLSGEKYVQA